MDKAAIELALKDVQAAMRADGGDVEVVKVEDGKVYVRLAGACSGCMMRQVTLKNGVERAIRQKFPEIKEVVAL